MKKNKLLLFLATILIIGKIFASDPKEKYNNDFDGFIQGFARDREFQKESVKFPLIHEHWSNDNGIDEKITLKIEKENYKTLGFLLAKASYDVAFYDINPGKEPMKDFTQYKTDYMILRQWGMTDYENIYYFEKINGQWFLVKIESNDPW